MQERQGITECLSTIDTQSPREHGTCTSKPETTSCELVRGPGPAAYMAICSPVDRLSQNSFMTGVDLHAGRGEAGVMELQAWQPSSDEGKSEQSFKIKVVGIGLSNFEGNSRRAMAVASVRWGRERGKDSGSSSG